MSKRWQRDMVRVLTDAGCEVSLARSGHYRVTRRGQFVCTFSASPSDWRSVRNLQSTLRQRGLEVDLPRP